MGIMGLEPDDDSNYGSVQRKMTMMNDDGGAGQK
jgi:hypothetical protein